MAEVRISDIARRMGVESREVIKWANDLGLDVKSASSRISDADYERFQEHVYSVTNKLAAAWGGAMVDVLEKIEKRLPASVEPDPEAERRFLRLRESLGPRGRIDPAKPVILKDVVVSAEPIPPATARWCDGYLVGLSWVGDKSAKEYEVTLIQGGDKAKFDWPTDQGRLDPDKFDEWEPIDRIVVRSAGKTVAVGGPIAPRTPRC